MILVDANLLVYAAIDSMPQHAQAKRWLDSKLNGNAPVGIPWVNITAFLRIVTNSRIFNPPALPQAAWQTVAYWLDCKSVWIPQPSDNFYTIFSHLYAKTCPQGNLVPDTYLAALALDHGLILCSTDQDFSRFADIRWENPLT